MESALAAGREAARQHAWDEVLELLGAAERDELTAEDLEHLGEAAWWKGQGNEAIAFREQAYGAYLAEGRSEAAARVAIELAWDHFLRLAAPIGTAWLTRAESLLAELPETSVHGYLLRIKSVIAFEVEGRPEDGLALAEEVEEIGRRQGDSDLQALGMHDRGRILVAMGRVEEGMALMDQAMVAAVGGELGPMATGRIYCNMISTCEKLADYRRAGQWTEAARRWCERQGHESGFPGICRVHRAEIMRLRGDWRQAESEAERACDELRYFLNYAGEAFYEIGEIRVRLGDLEGAKEAFRQAHDLGRDPQPGLARLRMYQNQGGSAMALLQESLARRTEPLARAKILPTLVSVAISGGHLELGEESATELEAIASQYGTEALHARADVARGEVLFAAGEAETAARSFRSGWNRWRELDLPYEAAEARLLLGEALRSLGREEAARLEIEAARTAFQRLGASPDARRASRLLDEPSEVRTRALMFTDIVGSTKLVEVLGDDAWRHMLAWHDDAVRDCFDSHGGTEIDQAGDGFFVAFDDPAPAVACAVEIQRRLERQRREHGFAPRVRIGVHSAAVGEDYRGRGVHLAARIAGRADADEILASRETMDGLAYPTSDPQGVQLKGVSDLVEVVSVSWR